jgi:lipoprotein-anchoring transpeptidase ErfK/SrfK
MEVNSPTRALVAACSCLLIAASCSRTPANPPAAQLVRSASLPAPSPIASPSPPQPKSILGPGEHGIEANGAKLQVWHKPSGSKPPKESVKTVNPLGQDLTMLVDQAKQIGGKTWLRVYLPDRPNESEGWVRQSDVRVVKLHERIKIDLSKYRLWYYRDDKLVDSFKVGIGRNIWPTPTGTYYVWARVPQASPTGPYGAFAVGLSGFSPVLSEWPGGGRVAIHGTANPADPGHKVSHGCIRVFNKNVVELRHVPMGTPVIIQK